MNYEEDSVMELDELPQGIENIDIPTDEEIENTDSDNDSVAYVDGVTAYLHDIGSYKVLSKAETEKLFVALQNGDETARNKIIEHNLKLAFHVAKKYRNFNVPLIDLVQEANIGLCKAIDKYDLSMGYAFTTYATWWITAAIRRALQDQGSIHVPVYMVEWINKVRKAQRTFESKNEDYDESDIARVSGLKPSQVKRAMDAISNSEVLSLDYTSESDDKDSSLGSTIADETDIEDESIKKDCTSIYLEVLKDTKKKYNILSPREADIVCRYFGYPDIKRETFEEIAADYGVSKQRVAQIHAKALEKLRSPKAKQIFLAIMNGDNIPNSK
jgi:RNA polymerase sigma factor (sigma-70 family)